MRKKQKVSEMADEVLARQARNRAERTGESFEEALKVVLETEAGRQLAEEHVVSPDGHLAQCYLHL